MECWENAGRRLVRAMPPLSLLILSSCMAAVFNEDGSEIPPARSARTAVVPTVHSLACDIDMLERHIERYGSVTVKQPDVWGQARLTTIRNEFEQQMQLDLGAFKPSLQGTFSAADQAYLVNALALSAAASGTQQVLRPAPTAVSNVSTATGSSTGTGASAGSPLSPPTLPTFSDFNSNVFGAFGSQFTRNPATLPNLLGFQQSTISLEPTIIEEQKARYLNALHELRRINEGDDTADSPGYSLNLVRLPVSILPGNRTDIGYGAELTLTMRPHLGDDLLPTTFRNLVLNDLVDQIGFPATQFINNSDNGVYFEPMRAADLQELFQLIDTVTFDEKTRPEDVTHLRDLSLKLSLKPIMTRPEWLWVDTYLKSKDDYDAQIQVERNRSNRMQNRSSKTQNRSTEAQDGIETVHGREAQGLNQGIETLKLKLAPRVRAAARAGLSQGPMRIALQIPASKSRRARMPFPPTEMPEIYGYSLLASLASETFQTFYKEPVAYPCVDANQIVIHLPDVQGHLQEQIVAVQKLLQQPGNFDLWQCCNPELVAAVRNHAIPILRQKRTEFLGLLQSKTFDTTPISPVVAALAWATIVESALLTDQLILDMKEAATAQGLAAPASGWFDYYVPSPSPEARAAFNQYVQIRWPMHIFALDPVQQQQNIGSTFSGRREMQLALSMAFVNGQINASDMMRYARRVEFDAQTIDLNGTTVGFSNGNETFGWRFYPRYQVPDVERNVTVIFRDLLWGGPNKNDLLHQRRLEPGIRECDAIVIMPSFVPYASLEVSSNWFSLTNPRRKELNAEYAMRLSHQVKSIRNFEACVMDGDQYRDGDLMRLVNRVGQLETRLPFQSMSFQVPYENTLGGFGMFNTGVTDLSPELTGWYGAPAVNPSGPTTVYLTGDHFSVMQTSALAGGQPVQCQLLSRQVLQAVIPANTAQIGKNGEQYVDLQVATPYGVTQHLLIPVCGPATASDANPAQPGWQSPPSVTLAYSFGGLGIIPPTVTTNPKVRPTNLVVVPGTINTTMYDTVTVTIKLTKPNDGNVSLTGTYNAAQGGYVISGNDLATQVFNMVGAYYGPTAYPPPQLDGGTTFKFTSSAGGLAPISVTSTNKLSIMWVLSSPSSS